jgi:hypothetical protein
MLNFFSEPPMITPEAPAVHTETDHELLESFMGPGYFVLQRIHTKIKLQPAQKQELMHLIEDRNHFGIWEFVNRLRQ